jgi:ankyrin repeat protein
MRQNATPRQAAARDSAAPRDTAARAGAQAVAENRAGAAPAGGRATASDSTRREERAISYGELVGAKGGLTPLLFAIRQGNTAAAMALLDAGAKVNQVSEGDRTSPLLMATINGHFDLAMKLLERGADPKLASHAGATPLYATINVQWAAKSLYPQPTAQTQQQTTYLELMEALIKKGADVNARLTKHLWYMSYNFDLLGVNTTGATPFWRAAYGTDVPAMKLLVKYGADPKIPTLKPAGRQRGDDAPAEDDSSAKADPSGLAPIPAGGPGVYPIHAASGVGYGEGYAANSHRHAPDAWVSSVKYLIEELGADVNARDFNGYNPMHHAAARGDNELIQYLMSKGGDVTAVSRKGQTTADMANGPVQRIPPFLETVALLEKLGSKNNHKCRSC